MPASMLGFLVFNFWYVKLRAKPSSSADANDWLTVRTIVKYALGRALGLVFLALGLGLWLGLGLMFLGLGLWLGLGLGLGF